MRISIRNLFSIILFGLVFVITVFSYIISQANVTNVVRENIESDLLNELNLLQSNYERYILYNHAVGINQSIAAKASNVNVLKLLVTYPDGTVRASTTPQDLGKNWRQLNYQFSAQQITAVAASQLASALFDPQQRWIDGVVPICQTAIELGLRGSKCGFAVLRLDYNYRLSSANKILIEQSVYLALGSLLSALFLLLISQRLITRRVQTILHTFKNWIGGDRQSRIVFKGNDELSDIAGLANKLIYRFAQDENTLRKSTQLNDAIISGTKYAIISTSPQGLIQLFNSSAEQLWGGSAELLVDQQAFHSLLDQKQLKRRSKMLAEQLHRPVRPDFELFTAQLENCSHYDAEWIIDNAQTGLIPIQLSMSPLFNADGEIEGYLGVAFDLSEQKESRRQLYLAEKVFNNTSEAIMVTDKDLNIIDINQAYTDITGYSTQDIKSKRANLSSSGHHDDEFFRQMWEQIKATGAWSGEIWDRRKSGELLATWLTVNRVLAEDGSVANYVGLFKDITKQITDAKELHQLAYYDQLTQLPNRVLFNERLSRSILDAKRTCCNCALLFLDLDRFKYVNDTYGHKTGDQVLIEVAKRLKSVVRSSDTIARLGGDEFVVIVNDLEKQDVPHKVNSVAQKISDAVSRVYNFANLKCYIDISIGVAVYPDDGQTVSCLSKNADTAMYKAKNSADAGVVFFTDHMNRENERRMELEGELRGALENNELYLHYQPLINIKTRQLTGFEALLRWHNPQLGDVSPLDFIAIAEDVGLIIPIGDWVMENACRQLSQWLDLYQIPLSMSINVSAKQIRSKKFFTEVKSIIDRYQLPHHLINLEITESVLMEQDQQLIDELMPLYEQGIKISIDDFGTGYSCLSYLKNIPVTTVKIDRCFIANSLSDSVDLAIVRAIISIADSMSLQVVAEGIECEEQHQLLQELNCQGGQGYLYAKPLSVQQAEQFISKFLPIITQSKQVICNSNQRNKEDNNGDI
ncbi:putative bifunctional diguanylate cyclase/phosphodiesterase [Psychromonas aquimarina]|uniref:putative bifunctional diguanylate cyclase/phosphodiesterase n=1 Tax=Psychromonas aquimarina TaxID=444919 RepID=UPI0004059014|nr:EAL domain-containing protein [Psychromonas aquimarina]